MKVFNIKTTRKGFYLQYLLVLSEMIDIRFAAMKVLASILYYNDMFRTLDDEARNSMLFSRDIRSKILQGLEITRASLDNQYTYLRKKGILLGVTLNPKYDISYDTHKELMFSFKMIEDD
jgi:hypothetical protein